MQQMKSDEGLMIAVHDPISGKQIGQVPRNSPEQVEEAVARARVAQKGWEAIGLDSRRRILRRFADLVWAQQKGIMRTIRQETGKTDSSAFSEVLIVDNTEMYYHANAPRLLKPKRRNGVFPIIQRSVVHYKPHGVVGIISPWNYPFELPLMDSIPALMAGNAVIYKPSEIAPLSLDLAVSLLHEAGVPADVAIVMHGDGVTGTAVVDHVDFVQFTGSTEVGRKVAVRAAQRLIPFSVELGGKDPAIVLQDADIDMTVTALLRGAFENTGQVCISVERVYVEEPIYDQFIERVRHYAKQLVIGAGDGYDVHLASMVNNRELERTDAHVQDALTKGATLLHGGQRRPDLGPKFYEPTILSDVNHDMTIMQDETFGPIMPIMKVRNEVEALLLANDTEYGLAASIFSRNLRRAAQLALKLDTGDVCINRTQFGQVTPYVPTGGQRASGLGRRNGPEGLYKYTAPQSILIDTMMGQKPQLSNFDPLTMNLVHNMRKLRRRFRFLN